MIVPLLAADDMDELVYAVKHAIQQCGLQVHIRFFMQRITCSTSLKNTRMLWSVLADAALQQPLMTPVNDSHSCVFSRHSYLFVAGTVGG